MRFIGTTHLPDGRAVDAEIDVNLTWHHNHAPLTEVEYYEIVFKPAHPGLATATYLHDYVTDATLHTGYIIEEESP